MARGENKGKPKARAKDIRIDKRRELALQLRIAGASFREIARTLRAEKGLVSACYSEGAAHADVVSEVQRLKERLAERAEEVQRIEVERCDRLLAAVWERAERGDDAAVHTVLRIMDRRSRYMGLDAPTKVAPTTPDGASPYEAMTDEERATRLAAIFDAARERRGGADHQVVASPSDSDLPGSGA